VQTVHFTIVSANQFNLAAIVHEVSLTVFYECDLTSSFVLIHSKVSISSATKQKKVSNILYLFLKSRDSEFSNVK
jgi:hypothetical protein